MTISLTEAEIMAALIHYVKSKTTTPEKFDYKVRVHWRGEHATVEVTKKQEPSK